MEAKRIEAAVCKAADYINKLTINSKENIPEKVLGSTEHFFTWDNEKRSPRTQGFLYDYSYYNGVVMEGLYDIYEADPEKGKAYASYVKSYLDALMEQKEDGGWQLNFERSGYVDCHGADCYKTAVLFERFSKGGDAYGEVTDTLYRHLTDESYVNSLGHTPCLENMPADLGHNYWHSWRSAPKYKIWLDGIYMLQPFLTRHAVRIGDKRQLELVQERLDWVAEALQAPNGMYYHAGNGKEDVCPFFWTRAMGWYGMAMVDIMEAISAKGITAGNLPMENIPTENVANSPSEKTVSGNLPTENCFTKDVLAQGILREWMEKRKAALKLFVDGMLKYQDENGIWKNLADRPATETNRPETSGTAMMSYIILKGVRMGWLDISYREAGVKAFVGLAENKLGEDGLKDIYLKAIASGDNNYEDTRYYLTDEGKGSGPFIMAYSEMLYL